MWKKNKLKQSDLDFETVKMFFESSHLDRGILKCKKCGQLYFYEFYEHVDWISGNDKMYDTYIPIAKEDLDMFRDKSTIGLLQFSPRILWDNDGSIKWIR